MNKVRNISITFAFTDLYCTNFLYVTIYYKSKKWRNSKNNLKNINYFLKIIKILNTTNFYHLVSEYGKNVYNEAMKKILCDSISHRHLVVI